MLLDDDAPAISLGAQATCRPRVIILRRVSSGQMDRPTLYQALSVRGQPRCALMGGPFSDTAAGKPYEAKSNQPELDLHTRWLLCLSRTAEEVYEGDQFTRALELVQESPVAAWRLLARQRPDERPKEWSERCNKDLKASMELGSAVAILDLIGAAPKKVAQRRLPPEMLVEESEKHRCYFLVGETTLIPPGLMSKASTMGLFPNGFDPAGIGKDPPKAWPEKGKEILSRILREGIQVRPNGAWRQVCQPRAEQRALPCALS